MQPNIQNLDFDDKVEKFCEVNNLLVPNLANIIITGSEKAANIILNAELETIYSVNKILIKI